MKIDLTAKIRTIDGKLFQQPASDGKGFIDWDCNLKDAIYGALIAQLQTDFQMSVQDKIKVFRLAQTVERANGALNAEAEEVTLIKDRASRLYGIHLFGVMADLIDPPATPPTAPPPPEPAAA